MSENDTWFRYTVRWMRNDDFRVEPITCKSVEVSDGMVRFLDSAGTVILAIGSNHLVEYELTGEVDKGE